MGLLELGTANISYFSRSILESILWSFGALCKISDVKIFKRLLLPHISLNFSQTLQKACIPENTGYYFSGDIPNFKSIWHFEDKLQLHIVNIHNAMLVPSGKKSSRVTRPGPRVFVGIVVVCLFDRLLVLLFVCFLFSKIFVFANFNKF